MRETVSARIYATGAMVRVGNIPVASWGAIADLLDMVADDIASYERIGKRSPAAHVPYGGAVARVATKTLGYEEVA